MSKKLVSVLAAMTVCAPAVPAYAKTNDSINDVTQKQAQVAKEVISDVSATVNGIIDSIEIEQPAPEVSYTYYEQPVYAPVVYYETSSYIQEPVMETIVTQEVDDSYQIALANYESALAAYNAASELVETTKEVEVEVTEEVTDEEGNVSTVTRVELQTVTETSYAGDVEAAKASLDAAATALEQAEKPQMQEVVEVAEEVTESAVVTAADNQCGDNATWTLSDMGVLTISGSGAMYDYTSENHSPWYYSQLMVNEVVVGSGITRIGNYAFDECKNMRSITIANTVTEIGQYAFNHEAGSVKYSLQEIVIPDSVTKIEAYAFNNCDSLKSVTIGAGLTSIGEYVFHHCIGLEEITLPDTVKTIEKYAFNFCDNLTTINLGNGVSAIDKYAFNWCKNLKNVNFGTGLATIGTQAFYRCMALKTITLPDSLKTIEEGAFKECSSLKTVTLNDGLSSIGASAFSGCTVLETIDIPASVSSLGSNMFSKCTSLMSINVDESNAKYTSLDGILYNKDKTTLIQCPIGKTAIAIPDTVTKVGDYAFYQCSNLASVELPKGITSIGASALYQCNGLTNVTLPNSVSTIGSSIFSMCRNLENVDLGTAVTKIPSMAFFSCDKLKSVTLPKTLTSIASDSFSNCSALTDVYYRGTEAEWNTKALFTFPDSVTMHFVPAFPFVDVPEDAWYYSVAKECYETGLISGTSATTFSPMQTMTRAMVVTILWRMEGEPATAFDDRFSDVSSKQWYATSISWAVEAGVVHGYGDGTFKPDDAVTREQVAVMLANYAQYKGVYVPGTKKINTYPDGSQVSTWAQAGVKWAITNGIISGNGEGYLRPKKSATRAEGAAMLLRMKNWL